VVKNRIHPLIEKGEISLSAGVYDVLSAKLAEKVGFKTIVVSGYAVAASLLGEPDLGLLTKTEVLEVARRILGAVSVPVVVDCDTGYGGALNVMQLVHELIAMKAAGMLLEDQTWPKRCGHMRGKSVIPAEEHAQKIRAAVEARGRASLLIVARTDAIATHGVEEAIRRGNLYKQAGADVIFVEAPGSKEEMRRIVSGIKAPVTANMIEGGKTPIMTLAELKEIGYVGVGYPLTAVLSAARAMESALSHLVEKGDSLALAGKLMSFDEFTSVVGLEAKLRLDEKYRT